MRSFEKISGVLGISEKYWIFDKNPEFFKSLSNISRLQEFLVILGFFRDFLGLCQESQEFQNFRNFGFFIKICNFSRALVIFQEFQELSGILEFFKNFPG
jgi:hypothetical protein